MQQEQLATIDSMDAIMLHEMRKEALVKSAYNTGLFGNLLARARWQSAESDDGIVRLYDGILIDGAPGLSALPTIVRITEQELTTEYLLVIDGVQEPRIEVYNNVIASQSVWHFIKTAHRNVLSRRADRKNGLSAPRVRDMTRLYQEMCRGADGNYAV